MQHRHAQSRTVFMERSKKPRTANALLPGYMRSLGPLFIASLPAFTALADGSNVRTISSSGEKLLVWLLLLLLPLRFFNVLFDSMRCRTTMRQPSDA